jgi:hypothetical protein
MRRTISFLTVVCFLTANFQAQTQEHAKNSGEQPALTIYNADFAVVRQMIPLELEAGTNRVSFTDATAHIEPDSVILRDPTGHRTLQILEQNYRNDPVSQELLLSLNEGKTINFQVQHLDAQGQAHNEIVQGKIVRSGFVPRYRAMNQNGEQDDQEVYQQYNPQNTGDKPIIEINGQLQFTLPGLPLFPTLGDNTILKPTLDWVLETDKPGSSEGELSYITGGLSWHADYNVIAPPQGDTIDLVGWITMDNQSGKEFDNARIKLMAGDVNKIKPPAVANAYLSYSEAKAPARVLPVTEKAFDEYHLYTLERPTTLHDRETKQVQFVTASGVKSQRVYVYNGVAIDSDSEADNDYEQIRNDPNYGIRSNPKVWVMQEFKNSKANNLGMPLPKGRLRFYRRDDDGQVEFIGENTIDHTPIDETIRVYTGNAFDIVGERRQSGYRLDTDHGVLDETVEIKVRNHKKAAVEVSVVEKLYRSVNWRIRQPSTPFKKLDAKTIEFRIQVPSDGEKVVTYTAHYSWTAESE